jgi:hypothetical protein
LTSKLTGSEKLELLAGEILDSGFIPRDVVHLFRLQRTWSRSTGRPS